MTSATRAKLSTAKTWDPTWAWKPTSSTDGDRNARSAAARRGAAGQAEAELGVLLSGAHELVGVSLDPGGHPQLHPGDRQPFGVRARRAGPARRSCPPRSARRRSPRPAGARRPTCCCRGRRAGLPVRRRPAPRGARRRWRRRAAAPPRGPGGPWPGTGRPWLHTQRSRRRRRRPPPGSGPGGGPRRTRTAGCRARPRRPPRRRRRSSSWPSAPTEALSGSRSRGSAAHGGSHAFGDVDAEQAEARAPGPWL